MLLGLVALGCFAGTAFAEETSAEKAVKSESVEEESFVVEKEFFMNLNSVLEAYQIPDDVKTFGEVYERLSQELQKAAEENPELLKDMIEKYGQEAAEGQKVVSVPLYFYIKG